MSPGSGVGPQRRARNLLLIFLPLTSALLDSEERGNVGCLFSGSVCTSNEVCFNDLVIGQCISASSDSRHVGRLGPLQDPELALLEAEMSRVFGLGFSWSDTYSQCVFQTFLHDITNRQPYDKQQCRHLLPNQPEDPDDTDREEEDPEDLFVPEPFDDYTSEDTELHLQTDDYDSKYDDEEQQAWLELQNVLNSVQQDNNPRMSEYIIIPEDEDIINENILDDDNEMILVPIDDFDPDYLPGDSRLNPSQEQQPRDFGVVHYLPEDIPETQQLYSDFSHPLQKREATFFDSGPTFEYILPEVEPDDYLMSSLDSRLLMPDNQPYEILQHPSDMIVESEEDDDADDDTSRRDRRTENRILLDDSYENSNEDISNYDFEYDETDQDQDDDILYYNSDIEPIAMETVFNRRERLDVKKPGPFYSNSPNNFYLDKLLPDDSQSEEDLDEDPGQTEYEYPLSSQEVRQKKGLQEPLLSYSDHPSQDNGYLYINIKNRLSSRDQAIHLWQYVADHLDLPKQVFSDFKPETSRILLKVNSNPKQLNATTMAKILENDAALKEHAKEDLGIEIDSFEAGDKFSVVSVYTGSSRLFLLLLLLTAGVAALLLLVAIILLVRRRSQRKSKQLPEEKKVEKEEPVREYKQLVRDWSRSSRASQASEREQQSKGAETNKILARASQNSDGSRNSSTSSWQEDPGVNSMDISTGHMVLSYMEDHLKNKQRLEQEWVGLCAYEAEPNATSIAFKVENKKKNRYPDKLPYDHNRVLLNALVNGSNSDYINASTVMDHDPRNPAYIVTQGPMTHTVADFWQMVWEQGSVVIVMLSKLTENGYQLCHRYWPEEGSEQYHIFEVHLVSEHVWCEDYLVRSLYLKNSQTGETRTVTQFHFLSWPDGNIPTSTKAILEFRRKVNKSYRGRSCPMILHCSDGVGRAGTYVLIDMVLNRMTKGSKEIDIAATLEHIRDQRAGMVQTRSQFEFCLMAVAEETHAILKALPQ